MPGKKGYLDILVNHIALFGFSASTVLYLKQKNNCDWLEEFYFKTEKKIDKFMEDHHKKRIRKLIHNIKVELSLYKELLVYIDMLFFIGAQRHREMDFNALASFLLEDIAEGVSYLLFLYID